MAKQVDRISIWLFLMLTFSITIFYSCKKDVPEEKVEICGNGIDDDNDGFIDYEDVDCTETGAECSNGTDDDGDGFIDGLDLDCTETDNECGNGIDDDGDNYIDCDDLDCAGNPNC